MSVPGPRVLLLLGLRVGVYSFMGQFCIDKFKSGSFKCRNQAAEMVSYQNQSRSLKTKEPEVGVVEEAGPLYSPLASNAFI